MLIFTAADQSNDRESVSEINLKSLFNLILSEEVFGLNVYYQSKSSMKYDYDPFWSETVVNHII